MGEVISEGAACRPNFSGPGRRRRRNVAIGSAVLGLVVLGVMMAFHVSAWVRLLVALPFMTAAITGLQVTRNTCIAHARTGMFENDDFTTTKVDEAFAEASRRVARTIFRDGAAIGAAAGVLGMATIWLA